MSGDAEMQHVNIRIMSGCQLHSVSAGLQPSFNSAHVTQQTSLRLSLEGCFSGLCPLQDGLNVSRSSCSRTSQQPIRYHGPLLCNIKDPVHHLNVPCHCLWTYIHCFQVRCVRAGTALWSDPCGPAALCGERHHIGDGRAGVLHVQYPVLPSSGGSKGFQDPHSLTHVLRHPHAPSLLPTHSCPPTPAMVQRARRSCRGKTVNLGVSSESWAGVDEERAWILPWFQPPFLEGVAT